MGGDSGIQIVNDLNPLRKKGSVGQVIDNFANTVGTFTGTLSNDINASLERDKNFYLGAAALVGAAAASGAFAGGGAAAAGSAEIAGGTQGIINGGNLSLSGGAGLGSSPYSLGYTGAYLADSSLAPIAGNPYIGTLGVSALESSPSWWAGAGDYLSNAGKTALNVATTYGILNRPGGGSSISIGGQGSKGETPNINVISAPSPSNPNANFPSVSGSNGTSGLTKNASASSSMLFVLVAAGVAGYFFIKKAKK